MQRRFSICERRYAARYAAVISSIRFEALEARLLMSADIRSIDGTGNNIANPSWGSAGSDLIRLAAAAYADGISTPALPGDLSARDISNILNDQSVPGDPSADIQTLDQNSLSDFGYAFGQFMDHDMDLTPDGGDSFPITVDPGDPIGPDALPFTRSQYDPATGTTDPRQQVTTITAFLDLSQVYGSSQVVADALRTFQGGLLKTSPGNMLPYDNTTYFTTAQIAALNMANDAQAVPEDQLYAAGDVRANENLELTTLETLFVRNHNLIAGELQKEHPGWSDEQLYQEARKLNIAEYQNIVYTGWIPAVLGTNALSQYTGYKSNVDPEISNEFSTVAFRFGHSLVSPDIGRDTNNGLSINDPGGDNISLAEDFFDPNLLNPAGVVDPLTGQTSTGIAAILKSEASGIGQQMDMMAVSDIRNLLFGNGGLGGEDLIARDVQRDRDNGIPNYNALRIDLGLKPVTSFSQITSNVQVQQELEEAYPGGVNTIDAFEGGLAEDHVKGSDVGPLFQKIMVDQFTRLRDGDRFFYLNENFNQDERNILNQGNTLAEVIEVNTTITNLQKDVFHFTASISGNVLTDTDTWSWSGGHFGPSSTGLAGITVQLLDNDGNILGTTVTNKQGYYGFNQFSGPGASPSADYGISTTGLYSIRLVLPGSMKQTSANPSTILISRGGVNVNGINFMVSSKEGGGIVGKHFDPYGPGKNICVSFMDEPDWDSLFDKLK